MVGGDGVGEVGGAEWGFVGVGVVVGWVVDWVGWELRLGGWVLRTEDGADGGGAEADGAVAVR